MYITSIGTIEGEPKGYTTFGMPKAAFLFRALYLLALLGIKHKALIVGAHQSGRAVNQRSANYSRSRPTRRIRNASCCLRPVGGTSAEPEW